MAKTYTYSLVYELTAFPGKPLTEEDIESVRSYSEEFFNGLYNNAVTHVKAIPFSTGMLLTFNVTSEHAYKDEVDYWSDTSGFTHPNILYCPEVLAVAKAEEL